MSGSKNQSATLVEAGARARREWSAAAEAGHKSPQHLAVVRPPGDSFVRALSSNEHRNLIDPDRARTQHEAFRAALSASGVGLLVLPPDEAYPDGCFTQDPAVVLDERALVGRSPQPSRRGEKDSIAAALAPLVSGLDWVAAPGTLEGGDVLRIGRTLIAGRSERTNEAGIACLRRFAAPLGYRVVELDVPPGVLHLTTAVTALAGGLLVGRADVLSNPVFDAYDRIVVGQDDPIEASNVLAVGNHVLVAGRFSVLAGLERRGFIVHTLDLSEFVKADAGPTCLALFIEGPRPRELEL